MKRVERERVRIEVRVGRLDGRRAGVSDFENVIVLLQ